MKKLIKLIAILIQTCADKEMEENLIGTKIRVNTILNPERGL